MPFGIDLIREQAKDPAVLALSMKEPDKRKVVYRRPNPVFRKATLRKMPPTTREIASLIGEATSVVRRLKAMLPDIKALEEKDLERRTEMEKVMNRLTENKKE
jgi:predicted nuclease with RNAse H fold